MRLKKLRDQVLVITGATSGIGLLTAELAVDRGARVVLAAQSESELAMLAERLDRASRPSRAGGNSARVACIAVDASDPSAAERIAERAVSAFGGFDTWVNNAANDPDRAADVALDQRIADAPLSHLRHVFETTFWGTVNGCRVALDYLGREGGVIINVGSVASDAATSQQGITLAATQAVNALTDALRMEAEADRRPVAVALVKAGSSDTFEDVARAVIRCAERPVREVVVSRGSRLRTALAVMTPRRDAGRGAAFDIGRAAPLVAIGALVAAGVAVSKRL